MKVQIAWFRLARASASMAEHMLEEETCLEIESRKGLGSYNFFQSIPSPSAYKGFPLSLTSYRSHLPTLSHRRPSPQYMNL
jgi:hypothetical protein